MQGLSRQLGQVERLLAVLEQLQVPLAQVREHLGIAGMDPVTANNFRDKDADEDGAAGGRRPVRPAQAGRLAG